MKTLLRISISFCALFAFSALALGQDKDHGRKTSSTPSNPAVVVVGSAAKGTWAVTKFATKTVAKPVAKTIFLKATPAVTKFALKAAAKQALPLVVKLSVL